MQPELPDTAKHDAKSKEMLDHLLDLIERRAQFQGDKSQLRALERKERSFRQEFAKHLLIPVIRHDATGRPYKTHAYYNTQNKSVVVIRPIKGVPSKVGKQRAAEWMLARNAPWDGSAPALRAEVNKALQNRESVPDDYFGLHVEFTVEIEAENWVEVRTATGVKRMIEGYRYS